MGFDEIEGGESMESVSMATSSRPAMDGLFQDMEETLIERLHAWKF